MKGIELSRSFYESVGRPWLTEHYPELLPHMSVGLAGEGSECLGFDDAYSADHDFSPAFCMWLSRADYEQYGEALRSWYQGLEKRFLGYDDSADTPNRACRTGVFCAEDWYRVYLGGAVPPQDELGWLRLRDTELAAATNGEVFHEGCAEFDGPRGILKSHYPEDVRLKKLCSCLVKAGQAGQYNYARCMQRHEHVAGALALSEFMTSYMACVYLLNRVYMPYYKWSRHGLEQFSILREAGYVLDELATLEADLIAWEYPQQGINLRDRRVEIIEELCGLLLAELQREGLTASDADFLPVQAELLAQRIKSPQLRYMPLIIG